MKVYVNGAAGRMGRLVVETLNEHATLECVGTGIRGDDLREGLERSGAQVVVDFTLPDCVYDNTTIYLELGVHPIIGATGLSNDQIATIIEVANAKQLGGVIAPNFSIGVIRMMQFAALAAQSFESVEIIEKHHDQKRDAPSGTAIKTAQMIQDTHGDSKQVPIHSVRLPGLLAHQEVIFGSLGETLTIKHDALDRSCFMPGVVLACERVAKLSECVYGLEHLLDD